MTFNWTFPPNWGSSVTETYRFKTQVLEAENGDEQRIATRNEPRYEQEFTRVSTQKSFSSERRTFLQNIRQLVWCPQWAGVSSLTQDSANGSDFLALAEVPRWAFPNTEVMLINGESGELAEISSVSPHGLTLTTPLTYFWGRHTKVYRARQGRFDTRVQHRLETDRVSEIPLAFLEVPGASGAELSGTPWSVYEGLEVFPFRVNWGSRPNLDTDSRREEVDLGGNISVFHPRDENRLVYRGEVLFRSYSEFRNLLEFFLRHRGSQKYFRASGFDQAFTPTSGLNAVSSAVESEDQSLAGWLTGSNTRKSIAVHTAHGVFYREIVTATQTPSGTTVVVDSPWGQDVALSDVYRVAFLYRVRFASDILSVSWRTSEVGATSVSLLVLKDEL